jgi:hypothetical protein
MCFGVLVAKQLPCNAMPIGTETMIQQPHKIVATMWNWGPMAVLVCSNFGSLGPRA